MSRGGVHDGVQQRSVVQTMVRSLLACVVIVATDAFMLVPFASRTPIIIAPGLVPTGERVLLPLRMDAANADDKAAAVKAVKAAKAAKAEAAADAADAADEKEETAQEKVAREAAEKAEADAKAEAEAKAKVEAEKAEAKAKVEAEKAVAEAARAAERKAAAVQKAQAAVNMVGKEFGYIKEQFVLRWTEEAIVVGDDNWAALTEEVPDLCDHIGMAKALLQREDAKCVAMVKALDQLQKELTGKLEFPTSDLVPASITIKGRQGLVAKSYAREKSLAREARLSARPNPMGATSWEGGRLW